MEQYSAKLVQQPQNDLAVCRAGNLSCTEKAGSCFDLAVKKWMEVLKS